MGVETGGSPLPTIRLSSLHAWIIAAPACGGILRTAGCFTPTCPTLRAKQLSWDACVRLAAEPLPDGEAAASGALRGVCVRALTYSGENVFSYFSALASCLTG